MKTLCGTIFVATVAVAAFGNDLSSTAMTMNPSDPCRFVDPFVGTSGTGHTFPAACVPFGLVQAGPDTGNCNWDHCSGYRFDDTEIFGFSQTHLNGTGCPDLGDVRILPFVGSDVPASMSFEKASEHASPGRYSVTLAGGVKVDVSATEHCAIYSILYPAGERSRLLVDPRWCITSSYYTRKGPISSRILSADVALDGKMGVSGKVVVSNWVVRAYAFKLEFNRPFVSERDFVFEFASSGEPLIVKVALSALGGVADAEHNLAVEIPDWDFDRIASAANEKWKKALSCVAVEGSDDQKRNFYTSLYHLFIQPNDLSDVGQTPFYSTFSTWDTFRAAHPLYTILVPERVPVMIDSMLKQGKMTGFLPIWTLWGKDNQCMIGTHSVPVIVDWFLKENPVNPVNPVKREFWLSAFAQIKDTLTKPHEGRYKERWDLLATYGYYPFDIIKGESVSRTLECAYDDWCAGKMAERLGLTDDAAFFFKRSGNWRNVFDPSVGFARGKDSEGRWREPFDPFSLGYDEKSDFTEGNAFQYTWHVMQDPDGLVEALGGRDAFVKRLDGLFEQKGSGAESSVVRDVTGLIGQYVHGNEPSHHVIYFYTLVGERDKTARRVRDVFDKFYLPKPDGLCGNDDCGQMSAWYVFSALGFYPFNPCGGTYVLGAPQIPKAAIRLADGKTLTVVAKNLSAENKYVKSVTLNGKPLDKTIEHADIMAGGEIVFEMTSMSAGEISATYNGREVALENCRISAMPFNRVWTGKQRTLDQTRLAKIASFDLREPGVLEIAGVGEDIPVRLYPFSESNRLVRTERGLALKLDSPAQYVLDFGDALPPLHVFADKPFAIERRPDDIWYGPGEHHAGIISPTNGQRVVIERGAVVHGELFLCGVTNVAVVGRGILDCSTFERADARAQEFRKSHGLPPVDTEFACHSCVVYASENVRIEGIVIRDTPFWSLIVRSGSRHVTIDGVKVVGQWRYNSDGIDISASSDVKVKDCFVRSFDDCLVVLGAYLDTRSYVAEDIIFENCRLWCDWGASFKLWSQPYTNTFRNIEVRDCKLLCIKDTPLQVKDVCCSADTRIEDVRFSNIEFDMDGLPLKCKFQKTDDMRYPGDSPVAEVTVAYVGCQHPREDHGNQKFVEVADTSGYHSLIRSVMFENFTFPGFTPPLVAELFTTVSGQEVRDIEFRSLPPVTIRRRGNVGTVRANGEEMK